MSEKEKKDFVVSDRRRFTESGAATEETGERANEAEGARVESEKFTTEEVRSQGEPRMASEAERQEKDREYSAGSKKLDELLRDRTGQPIEAFEMTFERLVASLYMTAMLQLGLMAVEGEQPRVDILGARQTIDTLGVLNEKTKGNLTSAEQNLLQQSLFELRMAFLELTNAIARAPVAKPGSGK
jgi:hypothetical protein